MKKRRKFAVGYEYLYSIGKLAAVYKNKHGETVAYLIYNAETKKHEFIKVKHD
jgi:hypothetical protein